MLKIFNRSELRSFALLVALMVIGSVLEAIGISMVVPIINVLIDPGVVAKYDQLRVILKNMPVNENGGQVLSIALLLIFYALKTLFITMVYWYQFRTVLSLEARLAQDLYRKYISTEYLKSKDLKASDISNNVVRATTTFSNSVVLSILTIFSEGCILIAIFVILIYFEPLGTFLVLVTLISFGGILYYATRNKMKNWGDQRLENEARCFEDVKDGMGGIKEIKLLHCESYFDDRFVKNSNKSSQSARHYLFVQQLPRIWLELIAIFGISLLLLIMLVSGRQSSDILPILGAFGLAALRMLPSASKIIGSITNIKYGSAATSIIKSALNFRDEINKNITQTSGSKGVEPLFRKIQLLNVSFNYPNRPGSFISNINLSINNGDIIGIIGESGSGKSTIIDIFLGLIHPQSGCIEIDGKKLTDSNRLTWQSQIGYVPQSPYLLDKTILENVAFGVPLAQIDEAAVISALGKSQLLNFISTLPLGLQTQLGDNGVALSGGQRQRIGIARALYKNPKILVLDEATSALDKETEESLISALSLNSKDKTIVLITHRQSTLKICNRIFEVRDYNIHEIFDQT